MPLSIGQGQRIAIDCNGPIRLPPRSVGARYRSFKDAAYRQRPYVVVGKAEGCRDRSKKRKKLRCGPGVWRRAAALAYRSVDMVIICGGVAGVVRRAGDRRDHHQYEQYHAGNNSDGYPSDIPTHLKPFEVLG